MKSILLSANLKFLQKNINVNFILSQLRRSSSTTNYETLKLSQPVDYVTVVEINRANKMNAMNRQFFEDLKQCFEQLNVDAKCRAVVLCGNGKAFTSGVDVGYLSTTAVTELENIDDVGRKMLHLKKMIERIQSSLRAVDKCQKPVIAAIHGYCIGAGVDLIAACDIRFCSQDVTFSIKEAEMGLAADVGTLQLLPKLIGNHSLFRELVYSSRMFNANEAKDLQLVSRIFENRDVMLKAAIELAETMSKKSPIAVQGSKINLNYARDHSVDDCFKFVTAWNSGMLLSEDVIKSIMASMSKSDSNESVKFDDV